MIWMLATTDLKMRYQGSWLGIIWVFLKPFSIFLVLNFVFSHLFYKDNPTFSIRLLVGIILWSFFAEATTVGLSSLLAKSHILKKIFVPKWIVIISATVHSALAFIFNLIIMFLFLLFYYHKYPGLPELLVFGVYLILMYGITVIFSFITAPLFIKIRDLNQIWEVLLQVLFFSSPIIYPMSLIPTDVQSVLYLNPMTLLIEHSRVALIDNDIARTDHLLIFIVVFIFCFLGSIWFFNKNTKNLIENM